VLRQQVDRLLIRSSFRTMLLVGNNTSCVHEVDTISRVSGSIICAKFEASCTRIRIAWLYEEDATTVIKCGNWYMIPALP
jgi:hypothetical protein